MDWGNFEKVQIISSKNTRYTFTKPREFPLTIYKKTNKKQSHRQYFAFEPAFDFDFEGDEKIILIMNMEIRTTESTRKENLKIRFLPLKVKHYRSLV